MATGERWPFGSLLKRYRRAAGLTHERLAERAGLSARAISDLERGVSRGPRAGTLGLLIEALQLAPEQRAAFEAAARPGAGCPDQAHVQGNLPAELTSFVGRQQEMRSVRGLLRRADIRLVTLTGPGGCGKTRLSIRVADDLFETFTDGVVYVALAPVADPDGVAPAIARALGAPEMGSAAGPASLARLLGGKELLLLLDNFEHLLEAAPLVVELLGTCPRLKLLVTSRAALRLSGEQEFTVSPLAVPDLERLPAVEALAEYPAITLFAERAARVSPDFALTAENAASVAAICTRLDGLPLALELAAARLKLLPPRALLARLAGAPAGASLRLLTGGARDLPRRHQTLRDTIAWSYHLLSPDEQQLFRQLAVFAGGCTIEAAEAVCAGGGAFDGLASLVDKSLVHRDEGPDGEPRFLMLGTIREFALEQLVAHGEAIALRGRHASYYLAMVEATGALLFAAEPNRARQAAEQANIQAALHWLVQQG